MEPLCCVSFFAFRACTRTSSKPLEIKRNLRFAACAGVTPEKIKAITVSGKRSGSVAMKRASKHFRIEEVIKLTTEKSSTASLCLHKDINRGDEARAFHDDEDINRGDEAHTFHETSESEEEENLFDEKATELSLSKELRLLVGSDADYRKIAGFINKNQGRRVLMKLPTRVFSGDFGIQTYVPIAAQRVLINGVPFGPEFHLRISSKDSLLTRQIFEILQPFKNQISEVESIRYNDRENFLIGVKNLDTNEKLRGILGVQPYRTRLRASVWFANKAVVEQCYYPFLSMRPEGERILNVTAFLDGFGGMGYSRQTCALKISEIEGISVVSDDGASKDVFDSTSNTICEFVGDESISSNVLIGLMHRTSYEWSSLRFKFLIVDHKAQHYVMLVSGSGADNKFPYIATISTSDFENVKDLEYYTYESLKLTVSGISEMWRSFLIEKYEAQLAVLKRETSKSRAELTEKIQYVKAFQIYPMFSNSFVIPALFHAYTLHVSNYVLQAFAYGTNTTVRNMLDLIDREFRTQRIHGMSFKTGDARQFISYAEAIYLKNEREGIANLGEPNAWKNCIHLLALSNELQQILYCKYSPSAVSMFRVRVVTRLLAEAMARSDLEIYLVKNEERMAREKEEKKANEKAGKQALQKGGKKAVKAAGVFAVSSCDGAGSISNEAGRTGEGGGSGSNTMATDGAGSSNDAPDVGGGSGISTMATNDAHIFKINKMKSEECRNSIQEDHPMMRHVYWPNLHIALPCIAEKFPTLRINRLLEEAHEQSWLINTRFLAATRGRQDFQTMQKTAFERRRSAAHRSMSMASQKNYRYADYRDIVVQRNLVSSNWVAHLAVHYPEFVEDNGDNYRFKTAGCNASKAGRAL